MISGFQSLKFIPCFNLRAAGGAIRCNSEEMKTTKLHKWFCLLTSAGIALFILSCEKEALPSLTTLPVTDISGNTAQSGGDITDDGGASVTLRGVVWSTSEYPTMDNNEGSTADQSGEAQFVSSLAGLTPGTTYYVRAYAANSAGTAYGNQKQFKTVDLALVTTAGISGITSRSAISGGNITDDGGAEITARGVVWGTSDNPAVDNYDGKTIDGSGTGSFESELTGLEPGTTYYVRAYGTNLEGTSYGEQAEFSTDSELNRDFNTKILEGYHITTMAFDNAGNAWIGTLKQGLVKYNSGGVTVFNSSNSTISESSAIWDLAVDSKDNVWIGTGNQGLIKYAGGTFLHYNSSNTIIPEDFISSIAIDSKDNIWFSSSRFNKGGIVKFNGTDWTVYTPGNSELPVNLIQGIAIDNNDDVWIALSQYVNEPYLVKIAGDDWQIFTDSDLGFTPYYLGKIQTNSENKLCVAVDYTLSSIMTINGPQVFIFDGESTEKLQYDNITKNRFITIDNNDNIWCGDQDTYAVYNGEEWFIDSSSFPGNAIFAIEQSPDNRIWIGTGNGIYKSKSK